MIIRLNAVMRRGALGYPFTTSSQTLGQMCHTCTDYHAYPAGKAESKRNKRDARLIAQCLCYGGYHPVYIPTGEDDAVKEYLRMRDDHKLALEKTEAADQCVCSSPRSFVYRNEMDDQACAWLKKVELDPIYRETLNEYMASYEEQETKIERYDKRIEEIASEARYQEKVKKLVCFLGVRTHTGAVPDCGGPVISTVLPRGIPMRHSWGWHGRAFQLGKCKPAWYIQSRKHTLRRLLIEASKGVCKGAIGHKSKELRSRQSGQPAEVIAYADKANTRLRSKYYKMIRHEKKKNVAVAAVARELACFIWGMMTENISISSRKGTSMPAVSQG